MAESLIRRVAQASHALTRQEGKDAHMVCEISKDVMKHAVSRAVTAANHRPCLQSCSADGTPMQVSVAAQAHLPGGRVVRRFGKASHEFLVAANFIRYDDETGEPVTLVALRDPMPLTHGKGHLAIAAACRSMWGCLRQLGHRGGVVQHYAFDRCSYDALTRKMLQYHKLMKGQWVVGDEHQAALLWMLEWVVFTPCALHDAQNALKWGLKPTSSDGEVLKGIYIGCASVRNSMDVILTYLWEWVACTFSFAADLDAEEKAHFRSVWELLGLEADLVHLLVEVLEFRFVDGRLLIKNRGSVADAINVLGATLLGVWKVRKFSDSRWLTVGASSCSMVACQLTGMGAMLQFALAKPSVSGYYLNGFFRLEEKHWLFMVQCAVVSRVPEKVQSSLLRDSRVALTLPALKEEVVVAMEQISDLPPEGWQLLTRAGSGCSGGELRASCLLAAHRAIAFLQFRVFSSAEGLPWRLCRGNVRQNLEDFRTQARPTTCPVSAKLWDLLDQNYSIHALIAQVQLLADVAWTTAVVEQLHGSAAVVSRYHPDYELATLMSRSLALAVGKLLPVSSTAEKKALRCKQKLKKIDRSCPEKATGRHMYFGDLCQTAKHKYQVSEAKHIAIRRSLIRSHSKGFKRLPNAVRLGYSLRSKARAAKLRQELLQRRTEAERALLAAREEAEKDARKRKPLVLSSASWPATALDAFQALLETGEYKGEKLNRLRDAACRAPTPWSDKLVAALDSQATPPSLLAELPPWARTVAKYREVFQDCAFVVSHGPAQVVYKFVFAMQSPQTIWVSVLTESESFAKLSAAGPSWAPWPRLEFMVDYMNNTDIACIADVAPQHIEVIFGLEYIGDKRVATRFSKVPLSVFLAQLPTSPPPMSAATSSKNDKQRSKAEPWEEKLLEKRRRTGAASSKTLEEDPALSEEEASTLHDEVVDSPDVRAALEEMRALWRDSEELRCDDFQVSVLGGAWTAAHRGVVADAFSGAARGAEAIAWCQARGIARSARFEIAAYGEEHAAGMARAWCSKMQYVFNLCRRASNDRLELSENQQAQWPEPSDLGRAEIDLASNRRAQARIRQIRSLGCV